MPYVGGKLGTAVEAMIRPTERFAREMAETGAGRLRERVEKHTPVDSGHLRSEWKTKPVVHFISPTGQLVYQTGVETDVEYAPYVEWGTGLWGPSHAKYLITPKNPGGVLHWVNAQGHDVFAAWVWHPGSPGAHMVAIAVAESEEAFARDLQAAVSEWAQVAEAAFAAGGKVVR
jgi:hypothetical protein